MSLPSAWDVAALAACLFCAIVYGVGLARSWRRAGAGTGVRVWEAAAFAGGWLVLLAALFSPLAA